MTCVTFVWDSNRGRESASSIARQICDRVPPPIFASVLRRTRNGASDVLLASKTTRGGLRVHGAAAT